MKLSDFNYNLPKELIANTHIEPRDHSRLLVLNRESGQIKHEHFFNIVDYLKKGDVLVFNNSKVFKARVYGSKKTGGKIELLLVRAIDDFNWEALVKGKVGSGDKVVFEKGLEAEIISKKDRVCEVRLNASMAEAFNYLEKYGEIPLPPYIEQENKKTKKQKNNFYQTVYAENIGSVAAPTAGFHFTPELMDKLKEKGVEFLYVTLHVGPGTFLPVETDEIEGHKMHEEFFEIEGEVWKKILQAKKDGRRIIAVGTTTTRVLESLALKFQSPNFQFPINAKFSNDKLQDKNNLEISNLKLEIGEKNVCDKDLNFENKKAFLESTSIFIYPPYDFKIVDALITNFHLPKSTLLMLVSAFVDSKGLGGVEKIKKIYEEAVEKKYRFYSFGDSMLFY